ncbi:hypothetical protein TWF718_005353 [Orbilia javanica]|uniref:BTB domain-containing protein n=1 Tax=Orbilia javanica TaxID=47235 RepID=A0AAN8MYT3_9PEZI
MSLRRKTRPGDELYAIPSDLVSDDTIDHQSDYQGGPARKVRVLQEGARIAKYVPHSSGDKVLRRSKRPWLVDVVPRYEAHDVIRAPNQILTAGSQKFNVIRLYDNREFSDITIVTRLQGRKFLLHKNIIALTSDYLRDLCSEKPDLQHFRSDGAPEDIFSAIIKWQYGHELKEFSIAAIEVFSDIYKACDKLAIPGLKADILNIVASWCEKGSACWLTSRQGEDFLKFFLEICQFSKVGDLKKLTQCAKVIVVHWEIDQKFFEPGGTETVSGVPVNDMFKAAYIGAMRETMGHRPCYLK